MYLTPSHVCYNSPKEIAWARQQLFTTWGITAPRRQLNPAAQPLSLHRSELKEIVASKQKYVASLKADGVRYLLLLTKEVVNNRTENVALMFDRKLIPYEVSLWAPAHMFELGSLFDGELVATKGEADSVMRFLVFDAMTVAGDRVGQSRNYLERFATVRKLFDVGNTYDFMTADLADELVLHHSQVVVVNHDCNLRMQSKPITPVENLRQLWLERQVSGFRQDGIVFTDITCPVSVGRNPSQYKWKMVHTIDVLVRYDSATSDGAVFVEHGNRKILLSLEPVLAVPVAAEAMGKQQVICKIVDNLILQNLDKGGKSYIFECTMELKMEQRLLLLFPIGLRHDKLVPNQLTTVESTIENVIEHIDIEELLDEVCNDVF